MFRNSYRELGVRFSYLLLDAVLVLFVEEEKESVLLDDDTLAAPAH